MFVAYSYKLYNDADSSLLFEAKADAPDVMIYGVSQEVVPGLISAIDGLSEGDKFDVTLPPAAAFGERYTENVLSLEKEIFERDGELAEEVKPGAELPMMTAEGYRIIGRVVEVGETHVKMDFNHPFAGLTVRYEGRIEQVRKATPDELQPSHRCGCGGGCGEGCGNNGDSCSSGGCCGDGGCCN